MRALFYVLAAGAVILGGRWFLARRNAVWPGEEADAALLGFGAAVLAGLAAMIPLGAWLFG